MFTVVVFFIVLSILVLIHECGHFIAAKKNGVKVEEFGFGLPPRIWGKRIGETLYSLNWLPFGGFVKVFGEESAEFSGKSLTTTEKSRSFAHKSPLQKTAILVAGVTANFLLGWVIISYLFVKGVPAPTDKVSVENVLPNSPAQEAGIQKGDEVVSVTYADETIIIDELTDISAASTKFAGKEVTINIKRQDQDININVIPRTDPPKDEGSLGIVISNFVIKKYSIIQAPFYGLVEAVKMTVMIFKELMLTLIRFVTFQGVQVEVAGPVGIARLTGDAARVSLDALLQLLGLLSLNLAVINILPFPALDGGRLALVVYEAVSKRKVNPAIEQKMNFVGFAILIGLILLVTVNDVIKLIR